MKGVTKWFNKGYGFITGEDGQDYFCHWKDISGEGFRSLVENQPVEFDPEMSEKGLKAKNVKKI